MTEILSQAVFWHWWAFAVVLVAIEVVAPGTVFLWMGVSAGIVGLALLLVSGLSWEAQWLAFAVLTVVSAVGWWHWQKRHPAETGEPLLNRRGQRYVGRQFTLETPIVDGVGKLMVDDTTWKIEGADLAAGAKVKVTGVSGTVLIVAKA